MTALSFMQGTRFGESCRAGHESSQNARACCRDLRFFTESVAELSRPGLTSFQKNCLARNAGWLGQCGRVAQRQDATSSASNLGVTYCWQWMLKVSHPVPSAPDHTWSGHPFSRVGGRSVATLPRAGPERLALCGLAGRSYSVIHETGSATMAG